MTLGDIGVHAQVHSGPDKASFLRAIIFTAIASHASGAGIYHVIVTLLGHVSITWK